MAQQFRSRVEDLSWREVDDEVVVLDLAASKYLGFNGPAAVLWRAMAEPVSAEALADLLVETFDIDGETARADVAAFLDECAALDLLDTP